MIKILKELKKTDKTQDLKIQKQLDHFGQRSTKGYFNRYSFPQYLDMISFADTYSMQPDHYEMVMDVLAELNPCENENMKRIRSASPSDYKTIQKELALQSSRTREHVKTLMKKYAQPKPKTFIEALSSFKKVFS